MRLVDADALIEAYDRTHEGEPGKARQLILDAPTIKERTGKWIKEDDEGCWWYECSECGDYPLKNAYGHDVLSDYCPACGAKMEG